MCVEFYISRIECTSALKKNCDSRLLIRSPFFKIICWPFEKESHKHSANSQSTIRSKAGSHPFWLISLRKFLQEAGLRTIHSNESALFFLNSLDVLISSRWCCSTSIVEWVCNGKTNPIVAIRNTHYRKTDDIQHFIPVINKPYLQGQALIHKSLETFASEKTVLLEFCITVAKNAVEIGASLGVISWHRLTRSVSRLDQCSRQVTNEWKNSSSCGFVGDHREEFASKFIEGNQIQWERKNMVWIQKCINDTEDDRICWGEESKGHCRWHSHQQEEKSDDD